MTVTAVTPTADASSPSHPDHDRWVKETTLAMEAEHARVVGLPYSAAVAENDRLLARMDALARRPESPVAKSPRQSRDQRAAERGVYVRPPRKLSTPSPSPCGRCGTCRNCMRERRVLAIIQRGQAGDQAMLDMIAPLAMLAIQATARIGKFRGMRSRDVDRMITASTEMICDKTIPMMGEWR